MARVRCVRVVKVREGRDQFALDRQHQVRAVHHAERGIQRQREDTARRYSRLVQLQFEFLLCDIERGEDLLGELKTRCCIRGDKARLKIDQVDCWYLPVPCEIAANAVTAAVFSTSDHVAVSPRVFYGEIGSASSAA